MLRGDVDEGTRLQGLMITDHSYTSNYFGTPQFSPHYYDPRFFMLVNDNTVVFLDISTFNHHQRVSPTNL